MAIRTAEDLNRWTSGLPALLGFEVITAEPGQLEAGMAVRSELLAPNGFLHGGSVVALADSACGYGTTVDLPQGAIGFTTIELKTNFLGTAREGTLTCVARRMHNGRTTQVWDAEVRAEGKDKPIALFRCTQLILYSKP